MKITKSTFLALVLLSPMAANADLVEIDFNFDSGGNAITSAGLLTLELNADGTVSALVESLIGDVFGVGIDAGFASDTAPEYDFSPVTPSILAGWTTPQGSYYLGFLCCTIGSSTSVSWMIGSVGQFSSVFDILGGTDGVFDAVLVSSRSVYGYAELVTVPEPSTLALLGIGLFGMGAARRRRKV